MKAISGLASEKLAKLCREIALDKKAEDAMILDVRGISNVADFFVICTGTSEPHLKAIADEIARRLCDEGIRPLHRDGFPRAAGSSWIIMTFSSTSSTRNSGSATASKISGATPNG